MAAGRSVAKGRHKGWPVDIGGRSPLEPEDLRRVRSWFDSAAIKLDEAAFAQGDIDEVLGRTIAQSVAATLSFSCYLAIVDYSVVCKRFVDVLVAFPLGWSTGLEQYCPRLDAVLAAPLPSLEVPGFYLFREDMWRGYHEVEDYRRPIAKIDKGQRPIIAFYQAFSSDPYDAATTTTREYARYLWLRTV